MFTGNDLVLTAICSKNCWSHLSPELSVVWKLFVGGPTVHDDFVEVPDITQMATGTTDTPKDAFTIILQYL